MSDLGQPTPTDTPCEVVRLPYECVNSTTAPITVTCAEIEQKARDGAFANGQTFPDGTAIGAAAGPDETTHSVTVCVACNGTPVQEDDGTQFTVECDAGSVTVNPNGGTNGTAYSCGAQTELGNGPLEPGDQISKADTITILPGGAATGVVSIANCPPGK